MDIKECLNKEVSISYKTLIITAFVIVGGLIAMKLLADSQGRVY